MNTVLIYRLGSLGDTVVSLPCLHKIAERYPHSRRVVLTNTPVSPSAPRLWDIVQGSGLVHEAIEYKVGTRSPADLARLWLRLVSVGAHTLFYLTAARGWKTLSRDIGFFRACGIRTIIGAPKDSDLQLNRVDPTSGEEEHECERLARSLASLGPIDLHARSSWDLRLSEDERETASRLLDPFRDDPFVAINMGGKAQGNDWGKENWEALLRGLRAGAPGLRLVFVGSSADSKRADDAAAMQPDLSLNFCGMLSPRQTAAVLSRASLFVGHDSGPLHLAAACDVRCVGLFSNLHKPHKWHPYGEQHRIIHPSGPISTISVDRVHDAIVGMLTHPVQ